MAVGIISLNLTIFISNRVLYIHIHEPNISGSLCVSLEVSIFLMGANFANTLAFIPSNIRNK